MSGNFGPQLSLREMLNCKPYMVVIAFILQDSPDKMLPLCQLMDRLEHFVPGRSASFRNIIRATLSNNRCFVKIPSVLTKRHRGQGINYWKLDHSRITEEVVHRNFRGLLEWFPELTSVKKETTPPPDHYTTLYSPAEACKAVNSRCEEFSSSFSIDSILKKDSPSGLCCKASPLSEESSVSVKVEQKSNWSTERTVGLKRKVICDYSPVDTHHVQFTGDSYNSYTTVGSSTAHGHTGNDAARPAKRRCIGLQRSQQKSFNRCKSYFAMIVFVLQHSPEKMLTSSQLMDRLKAFGVGRTINFENNIRVCLSSKKCFVKIPISQGGAWNNWKLDHSKISEVMVRRHMEGILDLFPELTSTVRMDSPEEAACKAVNSRCEEKFSSSFSIESILKKDSLSGLCCKASPLSE